MPKAHPVSLDLAEELDKKFHSPEADYQGKYTGEVSVLAGQKYDKIILTNANGNRSVHAFVQRDTLQLIKAAGWAAPQKNSDGTVAARFDLSHPGGLAEAIAAADPYGSYLYARS